MSSDKSVLSFPEDPRARDTTWKSLVARLQVPALVAVWLLAYLAPAQPGAAGSTWIRLAAWTAAAFSLPLQASSGYVTAAATLVSVTGAAMRLAAGFRVGFRWRITAALALFAVCAPLSIPLPAAGGAAFLVAAAVVPLGGGVATDGTAGQRAGGWRRVLGQECFPILSACCFLGLSWEYNAQLLTRGLLVAAGVALVVRAFLPKPLG